MEILVARHAGFCFGVERAIDIVNSTADKGGKIATFGPIIHNPQVVNDLADKGVKPISNIDEVSKDTSIIIRSHGIEKQVSEELKEKSGQVIDATCPFVLKAQTAAKELSEQCDKVIILGESDHPEVKGIISYITGSYIVIEKVEDVAELEFCNKYGFVAQTTQNQALFKEISDILKTKCNELVTAKTICSATEKRQEAAIEVASLVDIMIVIGGRNSANTTRLYHLCKDICPRTYHIETVSELNADMFQGIKKVGLTAGASTPVNLISKVREYILEVGHE